MGKKIIVVVLLLAILGVGYWLSRSYFRLPFDRVSPFQAVSDDSGVLMGLPDLGAAIPDLNEQQLWHLDARRVTELLDTLQLSTEVKWEEWWLLPEVGDGPQDAAYTFIGSAEDNLATAWQPANYGPTLGFGDGEIYTFGIATDDPIYFARYHNIFLAGKYPFQIENALLSLHGKLDSWEKNEQFTKLRSKIQQWPATGEKLILHTSAMEDKLPGNWLKKNELRAYEEVAEWMAVRFVATDSSATAEGVFFRKDAAWSSYRSTPDWDKVPEIASRVFPLNRKNQRDSSPLNTWLGDGGWQMELAGSRSSERIAPRLWILPIGDSLAYAEFRTTYLNFDRYLEESKYQLFDLVQLRTADGVEGLSDRRAWQPWVVELPDALLVGIYREDIERYLDYFMLGASLNKQATFLQLAGELPFTKNNAAGFYQWGPLADQESNWLRLLYPQYDWSKSGSLYCNAVAAEEGIWKVKGVLRATPVEKQKAALRWTASLPVQEGLRLLPVRSISDGLPQNFLLQAPNGDCWLLDEQGQILWTNRALPELFPPVWRVNLPNGKVNYSATSQTRLYVWDEQGTIRESSRITPAPAAGLTLVSFDQVSEPQLLFPTQEGTLEMLNWDGTPAEGWPAKLSGRVVAGQPITHWQLPDEDYLIAWTGEESWQMFGRYGNFLSSLSPVPEEPLDQPALEFNNEIPQASRLLMATATGKVNTWDLEGNIFPLSLGRGPVDHFLFINIWGDGRGDYVAQRGALVHLFGYTDSNDFGERWQQRLGFVPTALLSAEPLGVMAVQHEPDQLWLIDGEGEIFPGFPLSGEGQAVLSGDSQSGYFLVTTLRGEVYAYDVVGSK
jgi:hypothetical protein